MDQILLLPKIFEYYNESPLDASKNIFAGGGIATYTEVLTPGFMIDKGSDSSAPYTANYPLFLLSLAQLQSFFSIDFPKAMEFLSSIVGLVPCFYDHTSKHTVYIRDLKKNLQALSKEMVDLKL